MTAHIIIKGLEIVLFSALMLFGAAGLTVYLRVRTFRHIYDRKFFIILACVIALLADGVIYGTLYFALK